MQEEKNPDILGEAILFLSERLDEICRSGIPSLAAQAESKGVNGDFHDGAQRPLPLPASLGALADRFAARHGLELDACARQVLALSDFAQRVAAQQTAWFLESLQQGRFAGSFDQAWLARELASAIAAPAGAQVKRSLRLLRNRCQLWILWRQLTGASLEEVSAALSLMADRFIAAALGFVEGREIQREGTPQGADSGSAQRLVVLALGKLGAEELNLSSDVDLIFAYPEDGRTPSGLENQQFFLRVGQGLIDLLQSATEDGFAFRVDMRLRPYGASGPLAMSFGAMEQYFESQGRGWERYALVKARVCAGDAARGEELLQLLKPFVYRRYLDFGSVETMRQMKARLLAERHWPDNIKLGPGGIRDAEFAVQVQQLVHGGRCASLQQRGFLPALAELERAGVFDPALATNLGRAYRFLRRAEHGLQGETDRQTHRLPVTDLSRARLAQSMGFSDYAGFLAALGRHRANVESAFERLLGADAPEEEGGLWMAREDLVRLAKAGFQDARTVAGLLGDLAAARERSSVGEEGRRRLDEIMPDALQILCRQAQPDRALARLAPIFKAVLRRSSYLALLRENPGTLERLVRLAGDSPWVAERLARHPMFLGLLLDEQLEDPLPSRQALAEELEVALDAAGDEEAQLDALREFKEQHVFRVAVAEARSTLPLMHASDYLSWLAEAVLEHGVRLAWQRCAARERGFEDARPFIVVGYGKLGGQELGPASDLDLVFLHDLPRAAARFLHRLVRALLHLLTVRTFAGPLYEIDMRLRPSGNAGPLVSSLAAFKEYQREQAWVWEHQALVRARSVAGDPALRASFEAARREILCQPRSPESLQAEVVAMRRRMAAHHGDDSDLKRGVGGIVDIEFMVQYLVLAWASEHPSLADWSDNVRILEAAGNVGVLPRDDAEGLTRAYLALRGEVHRQAQDMPDWADAGARLAAHGETVAKIWERLFGESRSSDD